MKCGLHVRSVGVIGGSFIEVHLPGPHVARMTKEAAIELAAYLAFMADGSLVDRSDNGTVSFRLNSQFAKQYAELIGGCK